MKNLKIPVAIVIMLFLIHLINLAANEKNHTLNILDGKVATLEYMLQNTNMGTNFYLAIPQNDVKNGQREEVLAIYVLSYVNTRIKIEYSGEVGEKFRNVKAFEPLVLSSANKDASFNWEVVESEVVKAQAVHITADDPVSVFVLNSRDATSDGYLAIPTEAWGKKYIHCAYYDHNENNIRRGGGFIVVSAHDMTSVSIKLRGTGEDLGKTVGGKKIGDVINVTLNEGQTYMVRGDGTADIGFDITGTEITSTYPVGVISFHQWTMIPNICPNGRDHLSEMLLPVQCWGKEHVTLEFLRKNQGDLIRVVASEDNTHLQATSYASGSSNVLANYDGVLKAGEFWSYLNVNAVGNNNRQTGVRGVTVWKTDKPVMVMQYAYSFPWDGDSKWDPLMILVPPTIQFKKNAILTAPINTEFMTNRMSFFAYGDPNDPEQTLLKSLQLDSVDLTENYQQYLYNRIPETDIYWGRMDLSLSGHRLTSETKIAGYVTGFSGYNSFGWPFIMGTDKVDQLDTLPPEILVDKNNCGNYQLTTYEQRNFFKDPNPQVDQGIRRIMLIKELSYNYQMTLYKPDKFIPENGMSEQRIFLNLIDPLKDGKAVIVVIDRSGNYSFDSVFYYAPELTYSSPGIDFGKSRIIKKHIKEFEITNNKQSPITITQIGLDHADKFKIENILPDSLPFSLAAEESSTITLSFTAPSDNFYDDSLSISTECRNFKVEITGTGVKPVITVDDWNAGSIEKGKKVCYEEIVGEGIRISNTGSDTLNISGFEGINPPFSISEPTIPPLPIKIAPGEIIHLESACFNPLDTGTFSSDVILKCDAFNSDTISSWKGKSYVKVSVEDIKNKSDFQVIPNPTDDGNINIKYALSFSSIVSLKIYNNEGKFISSIIDTYQPSGEYDLNYNIGFLPSGIYYLILSSHNREVTKKLVLSK